MIPEDETPACPKCKSDKVLPIAYGLPGEELMKLAEDGKVLLGGCIVTENNPEWSCRDCGNEWRKRRPFRIAHRVEGAEGDGQDVVEFFERGDTVILVVADGAGGSGNGRAAAEAIVWGVRKWGPSEMDWPTSDELVALLGAMDFGIAEGPQPGETTAVVAVLKGDRIVGASVGDSGCWLIGPDGYKDLTRNQERKPLVGSNKAIPTSFDAQIGDAAVLIATDGLLKHASPEQICGIVRKHDVIRAPMELVEGIRLKSGKLQDDVGILLCRAT